MTPSYIAYACERGAPLPLPPLFHLWRLLLFEPQRPVATVQKGRRGSFIIDQSILKILALPLARPYIYKGDSAPVYNAQNRGGARPSSFDQLGFGTQTAYTCRNEREEE